MTSTHRSARRMLLSERMTLKTSTELLDLSARADAGGIDEDVGLAAALVWDIDGVPRGAGDGADHRAAVLEDGIDEGGFSDIGAAD